MNLAKLSDATAALTLSYSKAVVAMLRAEVVRKSPDSTSVRPVRVVAWQTAACEISIAKELIQEAVNYDANFGLQRCDSVPWVIATLRTYAKILEDEHITLLTTANCFDRIKPVTVEHQDAARARVIMQLDRMSEQVTEMAKATRVNERRYALLYED